MVKFCVMRTCHNRDVKKLKGIPLAVKHHEFPLSEYRSQWEHFVNKYNRTVHWRAGRASKAAFLCTDHFEKEFYTEKGRLNKCAVPTIAAKFTGDLAAHWGLIPNPGSHLLEVINDFEKSTEEIIHLDADPLSGLGDCQHFEDLAEMPVHIETSTTPNIDSAPGFTEAEIVQMPVMIDMHMQPLRSPSPCPTEVAENVKIAIIPENESKPLLSRTSSFDSVTANAASDPEVSPAKKGRKRYAGDLTEGDFVSPNSRKASVLLFQCSFEKDKQRMKTLRQTVSRACDKIKDLESLLQDLQNKKLIDTEVTPLIKVKLNSLLASLSRKSDDSD